ncbi:MAG: hypothetical protein DCF16_18570 [Alphaproteobacteria bacterium]|nr:MAG: hypothetical protein DCF16_18570 [Alphaproteobacteria bacterium]
MTNAHEHAGDSSRGFEAFNARFLTPEQVARTFVAPTQYWDLLSSGHSVLRGPRGSGKTTLLKMLQPIALAAWQAPEAPRACELLDFTAIFVPADILWSEQITTAAGLQADAQRVAAFRHQAFRAHLALSFLDTLSQCARSETVRSHPTLKHLAITLTPAEEAELVRSLAEVWGADVRVPSIFGLRAALHREMASIIHREPSKTTGAPIAFSWIPVIESAVDLTNTMIGQPQRKWALLLDELEITPADLRDSFFAAQRSTAARLVFKLAYFPHAELIENKPAGGPQERDDFNAIRLGYPNKEAAYPFCRALLNRLIEEVDAPPIDRPEEVLGEGLFDGGRSSRRVGASSYAPGGRAYKAIQSLQKKDQSFARYLREHKIALDELASLSESRQAEVRKITPVVYVRDDYIKTNTLGQHQQLEYRSRKTLDSYVGAYSIFAISEGNPRILINLLHPLVRAYKHGEQPVDRGKQARHLAQTINRFRRTLAGIPYAQIDDNLHVIDLVNEIGYFFFDQVQGPKFEPEPTLSFVVDHRVTEKQKEALGRAINLGVVVQVEDLRPEEALTASAAGETQLFRKRFRLAYMFAPEFRLPLLLGRPARLSHILGSDAVEGVPAPKQIAGGDQLDLWQDLVSEEPDS